MAFDPPHHPGTALPPPSPPGVNELLQRVHDLEEALRTLQLSYNEQSGHLRQVQAQLQAASEQRAVKDRKIADQAEAIQMLGERNERLTKELASGRVVMDLQGRLKPGPIQEAAPPEPELTEQEAADQATLAWLRVNGQKLQNLIDWHAKVLEQVKAQNMDLLKRKAESLPKVPEEKTPEAAEGASLGTRAAASADLVNETHSLLADLAAVAVDGGGDPNTEVVERLEQNLRTLATRLLAWERGLGEAKSPRPLEC